MPIICAMVTVKVVLYTSCREFGHVIVETRDWRWKRGIEMTISTGIPSEAESMKCVFEDDTTTSSLDMMFFIPVCLQLE